MTRVTMATEIVLFVSFGIAATVALLMRSLDYDGLATLGRAAVSCVALLYIVAKTAQSTGPLVWSGDSKVMRPAGDEPALRSAPDTATSLCSARS